MGTRFPIIVTAPVSAAANVRVFSDSAGTVETRVFASATAADPIDQPQAVAAGASATVFVDGPAVRWLSAKVAGVEMAGGFGALRRYELEGGLSRLRVEAPPASVADEVLAEAAPTAAAVASVYDIQVSGSPDGGDYTLILTVTDFDGGADVVLETAAIAFDDDITAIALACETALIAGGYDGADVGGATTEVTFTFPPAVVPTLGDNSLTVSDEPSGDVDIVEVTVGVLPTRYPTGTQIVDTTAGIVYRNFGGPGYDRLGSEGDLTDPIWRQVSVSIAAGTKPALETTTNEATVVAEFNKLRTALIAWGLATDGDA